MDPEPGSWFTAVFLLDTLSITESFSNLPWGQILLFLVLLSISFFVSGSEVAFLSLSHGEVEQLKSEDSRQAKRVLEMISSRDDRNRLLATILITNNFVNVAAILVASSFLMELSHGLGIELWLIDLINVVLITGMLLLFGEIVPKHFARENRVKLARAFSLPIIRLRDMLVLPVWLLTRGTEFINLRMETMGPESTSLDDLRHAIDLTVSEDESKEEREILKGIVNFGNTSVKSIMRARVEVVAVEINTPWEELISLVNQHKYSRLPVYDDSLDNIKGLLHIKSLLPLLQEEGENRTRWQTLVKKAYFVPENKKIDDLLEELKSRRLHIAIVVDEFGGTAGIVTLEDIIEEIFGEIMDESDNEDISFRKIDDNTYIFEGRIPLNDVKRIIGLDGQTFEDVRGDSDSLGGLILELNGKIPKPGKVVHYQNFSFHIEAASKSRIIRVKCVIHQEPQVEL